MEQRDELVLAAFAKGASLRAIADAAGLTHVGVKKLVERRQDDFIVTDSDGNVVSLIEAKAHSRRMTPEQKRAYNIELNKRRKGGASS